MRIPIKAAKDIAAKYGLAQIIILAFQKIGEGTAAARGVTHVVTYGKTLQDCEEAAQGGNRMKDVLGWPRIFHATPARVRKRLEALKSIKQWTEARDGSAEADEKALLEIRRLVEDLIEKERT